MLERMRKMGESVESLEKEKFRVVKCGARNSCLTPTEKWLSMHNLAFHSLILLSKKRGKYVQPLQVKTFAVMHVS